MLPGVQVDEYPKTCAVLNLDQACNLARFSAEFLLFAGSSMENQNNQTQSAKTFFFRVFGPRRRSWLRSWQRRSLISIGRWSTWTRRNGWFLVLVFWNGAALEETVLLVHVYMVTVPSRRGSSPQGVVTFDDFCELLDFEDMAEDVLTKCSPDGFRRRQTP